VAAVILVDDHVLAAHIGGSRTVGPEGGGLATTCSWWWRLALAIERRGGPADAVDGLASAIRVPERAHLLPAMARVASAYRLNVVAAEALAAAELLDADVVVGQDTPRLRQACRVRGVTYLVRT
jgi:hypothetical protein